MTPKLINLPTPEMLALGAVNRVRRVKKQSFDTKLHFMTNLCIKIKHLFFLLPLIVLTKTLEQNQMKTYLEPILHNLQKIKMEKYHKL